MPYCRGTYFFFVKETAVGRDLFLYYYYVLACWVMYACDDGLNEHWIPNRAFRLQIILAIRAVVDSVAVR